MPCCRDDQETCRDDEYQENAEHGSGYQTKRDLFRCEDGARAVRVKTPEPGVRGTESVPCNEKTSENDRRRCAEGSQNPHRPT